jgi:hypothetical protein
LSIKRTSGCASPAIRRHERQRPHGRSSVGSAQFSAWAKARASVRLPHASGPSSR